MQIQIDFTNRVENNIHSQQILKSNSKSINNQCRIVLEALQRGEKLTTASALINYGIGDLRRRIKDLKDFQQIPVQSELIEGRFKKYYL